MIKHLTLAAVVSGFALSASAAAPVTILGMPLGGKTKPIRACTMNQIGSFDTTPLCWISTPPLDKGVRKGGLQIPGSATRPAWAAQASFYATVDKAGVLQELGARTHHLRDYAEIVSSVSSRFGAPTLTSSIGPGPSATWKHADAEIYLLCTGRHGCDISFTLPAYAAAQRSAAEKQLAKDAARPIAP